MKQSSTESHKKKLVQARLPFQILSPGVKNPEATPSEQRKRKASDNASEDVTICEVTEVKENHAVPVEKKPKIVNNNSVNDAAEAKTNQKCKKVENEEEKMEVDGEEKNAESKSLISYTPGSKGKCKSEKISQKSNKKSRKSNQIRNATTKSSTKKKVVDKSRSGDSTVVDIVDLCDSPCKTENGAEKPSDLVDTPKLNIDSSCESKKKQGDKLNIEAAEESSKEETDDKNNIKESELSKADVIDSKPMNVDKTIVQQTDATIGKGENTSESIDKHNNQSKCDTEKPNTHQTSPKLTITNHSSENTKSSPDSKVESEVNIPIKTCQNEKDHNSSSLEPKTPSGKSQSSLDGVVSGTPSLNESSTSMDVSLSSDCSTPTANADTPKLSKKRASSTPRSMTPKQLLKMKERENKLKEKERLKQEKEKKKVEEREEKQKLKQEKEEEKLRQKQEKEEEKRKEKEEKEKKKQAEIAQKNEEKRLKEEEKRIKEEEKKAKDEEKKKKEEEEKKKKEEKRLKEEQKEAEKRKSAQAFASFFLKSETKPCIGDEDNESPQEVSKFQPFEVKNDMRLAPLVRSQLTQDRRQVLDTMIDGSSTQTVNYLKELHQASYVKGVAGKTWPAPDETDDDIIIIESEKPNGEEEMDNKECEKKSEKRRHRAKLLQFHENRRPPYWGTWRKKSKYILPRTPLNEDKTMFEYDIDSDDEWEEPEDGESLRGSENEESQDEQYEEDNDMFVPHGYLSDEEGQDDLDDKSPEAMKLKLKFLQQEFEAERNEKQEKLKPRLIGCVWFCNSETEPSSVGSHIAELFLARRAVWGGSDLPLKMAPPAPPTPPTPSETGENEESRGAKRKLVPESMIPTIIRTIHGSRKKLTRMLADLLNPIESDQKPSKRCLVDKIREIASWTHCEEMSHHCWFVKEEVRQAYNLMDLNISPLPPRIPSTPKANITKFTKVLTSDERLKLLSCPKESPKSTTPSIKQPASGVKNATPKVTLAKATPAVKKRISFTTLGPVQSPLRNFVSVKTEGSMVKSEQKANNTEKSEEKAKKRITPVTLTSSVTKPPPPPPSEDQCVVLSD